MKTPDDKFAKEAKREFDRSVDALDAGTLSRLNRARQAALASGRSPLRTGLLWIPAGGVAAAIAVAFLAGRGPGVELRPPATAGTDLEILLGDEDIGMLEDLEFYSWLDTIGLDDGADVG